MIYCDMFPARLLKDLYVHVVSNSAPEGTDHWQLLEAVAGGGGGGGGGGGWGGLLLLLIKRFTHDFNKSVTYCLIQSFREISSLEI